MQAQGKQDLEFIKTQLLESLNLESNLEEAVRTLFGTLAPDDVKTDIHSALVELLSGIDSLKRIQKNNLTLFKTGAEYWMATKMATATDDDGFSVKESKLWESLCKVQNKFFF